MQSGLVQNMMRGFCLRCKKDFRKREKIRKFCSLSCANGYNRNGLHKVTLPPKNKILAEFIGICLGDGYACGYQSGITLNSIADQDYLPYVKNLAQILFPGATVSLLKRKGENAMDIRINSKLVVNFLKKNGVVSNAKYVPDWILKRRTYVRSYVRGLFDTEGSISFKTYTGITKIGLYKQLNFRNANIKLMTFVRDSLLDLGLKPTTTLKRSLYLSNHQGIGIYKRLIGFSNPKLLLRSGIVDITGYEQWKNSK